MCLAKLATSAMESFSHKAKRALLEELAPGVERAFPVSHYICRPVSPNFLAASQCICPTSSYFEEPILNAKLVNGRKSLQILTKCNAKVIVFRRTHRMPDRWIYGP